jgi:cytochrome c oxidase cbb3-type subunit 3
MSQRVRVVLVTSLVMAGAGLAGAADVYKPSEATLELYKAKCQQCHMADGNSPLEPLNFADGKWIHGDKIEDIAKIISEGAPGTAMLPFNSQLTPEEIQALARYVRSFDKTPVKEVKPSGTAKKAKPTATKTPTGQPAKTPKGE